MYHLCQDCHSSHKDFIQIDSYCTIKLLQSIDLTLKICLAYSKRKKIVLSTFDPTFLKQFLLKLKNRKVWSTLRVKVKSKGYTLSSCRI